MNPSNAFARFVAAVPIDVLAVVFAFADNDPLIGARLAVACKAAAQRLMGLTPYEAKVLWRFTYRTCFPGVTRLMPSIEGQVERDELTRGQAPGRQLTVIVQWLRHMVLRLEYAGTVRKVRPFWVAQMCDELEAKGWAFEKRLEQDMHGRSTDIMAVARVFLHMAGRVFESRNLGDSTEFVTGGGDLHWPSTRMMRIFPQLPPTVMRLTVSFSAHKLRSHDAWNAPIHIGFSLQCRGDFEFGRINDTSLAQLDKFLNA